MADDPTIDAVRVVYEATGGRLWRAILAWSGSRDVADDAVAEAFAQVLRRGTAVADPEAWVWRAAFRIAAGELQRHDRAASARLDDRPAADEPERRLADALLATLHQLSPQQRACVVLRDVGGLSPDEVATALGTSVGTVRIQHLRGRRRLRRLLEEGDDG